MGDAQPLDDAQGDRTHWIGFGQRGGLCRHGVDRAADLRVQCGIVGEDRAAQQLQQRPQSSQQARRDAAFHLRAAFGEIGQRDQCAEDLVGGLQPDQAGPAAHAGGAARAQRVEHDAARRLDCLANGAAVFAGVRLPARGVAVAGGQHGAQVGGQGGEGAIHLGHRAARRQERIDAPDHQGEHGGP